MKHPSFYKLFGKDWRRGGAAQARRKQAKIVRLALEQLEDRCLLSVLPPPIVTAQTPITGLTFVNSGGTDNQNTPSVAVDPLNPLHLAAVFGEHVVTPGGESIFINGSFSSDGGHTWSSFFIPGNDLDPTTTNPTISYTQETDPTIAFDRNHNFYISYLEHNSGNTAGEVVLRKYAFGAFSPTVLNPTPQPGRSPDETVVYNWAQIDGAVSPTLTIDTNPATFTDPKTGAVQTDPFSGDVYVAWSNNITPPPAPVPPTFNPNPIFIASSSDGGFTFSSPAILNGVPNSGPPNSGYFGNDRNAAPQIVVGKGGQVTAVWDDFGTLKAAGFNGILSNIVKDGGAAAVFNGPTGSIGDAVDPGSSQPHIPAVTSFPVSVSFAGKPGFNANTPITNLSVTLDLIHANLSQLRIELVSPTGQAVALLLNQTGADGKAIPGQGVTGANMGILNGFPEGTVFDDNAFRRMADKPAAAPFVGHFRAETGFISDLITSGGVPISATAATGTWTLRITDFRHDTNPVQSVGSLSLDFTGGLTPSPFQTVVTDTKILGALTSPFPGKPAVAPDRGIGPGIVIASDNTLGSFSPHQGRLYVAYVDNVKTADAVGNLTIVDQGSILLSHSDDGGLSWSSPIKVNADNSFDGVSGGKRTQFEPAIAVDQFTGDVAVSFLDASLDPSNARVMTSVAISTDGGQTFSQQATANTTQTVTDAITLQNVNVQPIPDNQSAGNPNKDAKFGFGDHQGLAFSQGQIHPVWASNSNGGINFGNNSGKQLLDIWTANIAVAAGPRIIDSTMGPVQAQNVGGTTFNNTFVADGTPLVDGFAVTFDRPVDPTTFTPALVQAFYHDTTPGSALVPVPIGSVTPLNTGPFGATSFLVRFQTPQNKTGTYSYSVSPSIRDSIRTPLGDLGNLMDQNANAIPAESATAGSGGDVFSAPTPVNDGPLFRAPFDQETLPIIVPGPHIVSTRVAGGAGADNTAVDTTVSAIDVTFDRDMNASTITTADILRMVGPTGLINGPFTVVANPNGTDPDPNFPRTFRITFPTQTISGTYTVTLASSIQAKNGDLLDTNLNAGVDILLDKPSAGTRTITYNSTAAVAIQPNATITSKITVTDSYVIQGLTLTLNITDPDVRDLTGTLTAPDGTQIRLFTQVGGNVAPFANFNNTVFDDAARTPTTDTNPIQNGRAPFTGAFNPQQPLSVLIGKAVPGIYTLTITNSNPNSSSGTLNSWALNVQKAVPKTGLGEDIADQATASFRIFTMSPSNAQSHNTWTAVGPASNNGGSNSSRVTGLAVDPSDPSGNTVFVGGASGGVWKTTNFLTTNPQGPTYVPLTDFGPTFAINIGGIAVFGRNGDPKQSIVFASTGEGDTGSAGVGIIRSLDGGATWTLLDSTDNTKLPPQRDHKFVGTTSFKVLVDPVLSPTGVIVFAALSGPNGGIWVSHDTGAHWTQTLPGDATDIVLAPSSGDSTTGNLRTVYAAIRGRGVFISQNGGTSFNLMSGGVGDPLIRDDVTLNAIGVTAPPATPNGAKGRIVLATPALSGSRAQDLTYQGWLYAFVSTPDNHTDGFYLTKDFGQNWTKVKLGVTLEPQTAPLPPTQKFPTNDDKAPDIDILGTPPGSGPPSFAQGNYDISLAIDPNNPNITYLGGTADVLYTLLRVDTTGISDPHTEVAYNNFLNDGGKTEVNTTGPLSLSVIQNSYGLDSFDPSGQNRRHFLNLIRDPFNPFLSNATLFVNNNAKFNNTGVRGATATVIPFDDAVFGSTDQHRVISMNDPLTGRTRLIFGDDQGVFTAVDHGDGTFVTSIGTADIVNGPRNGNLQINQFYGGAVQPSQLAADIAGALFYGASQDNGTPQSSNTILQNGNIGWAGPGGDATAVKTDQTGSGTIYQYRWPCCGGRNTDFFQVNGIGRTNGLLLAGDDPLNNKGEWGFTGGFNFAVNPVDGSEIVISSGAGRVFRTNTQGINWFSAGEPGVLDGTNAHALAYGAPDPADPTQQLDNFIYAGTNAGHIFVTFNGGGAWTNISAGLDGSSVQDIVTNPHRGSHEAYAVTLNGVYFMADAKAPGATWTNITNGLFSVKHLPFGDPAFTENELKYLTSIAADYRIAILDDPTKPTGPLHPILYVGGEGGVYRSTDKGKTWTLFPNVANDQAPVDGGFLPDAHITHLDLAVGNINPTTGQPISSSSPNLLVATTYGRGTFAIRIQSVAPQQENFMVHSDNSVFAQKFDADGNPSGSPFLVANGSLRSVVSGRGPDGNLVLFGIDPYLNHVWELKFDANGNPLSSFYTPVWDGGAVESIAVGHDGLKNIELFAVDPFVHHVYAMKFDSNDDKFSPFVQVSKGGVATTLTVGHDGNGNPLLFTIDPYFSQVQELKFNAGGDPVGDFFRPGNAFAVKQIAFGTDGKGNPELFAIDPYFGHVFYFTFDANANATSPFFLQSSPMGIAKFITVGHDINNNPEVFSIGPDNMIYAQKFDNTGKPTGDFFATGPSPVSVTSIQVGFNSNGFQDLFGIGLGDNQVYEETFDASGNRIRTWFLTAFGAVKSLAVST